MIVVYDEQNATTPFPTLITSNTNLSLEMFLGVHQRAMLRSHPSLLALDGVCSLLF